MLRRLSLLIAIAGLSSVHQSAQAACEHVSFASVSPAADPSPPGVDVTVTFAATCSSGTPEFQVVEQDLATGEYRIARDWTTDPVLVWRTAGKAEGSGWRIFVRARAVEGTHEWSEAGEPFITRRVSSIPSGHCESASIDSVWPPSPSLPGPVVVQAQASCSSGVPEYEYWLYDGSTGAYALARPWSTQPVFVWDASRLPGTSWRVILHARAVWSQDFSETPEVGRWHELLPAPPPPVSPYDHAAELDRALLDAEDALSAATVGWARAVVMVDPHLPEATSELRWATTVLTHAYAATLVHSGAEIDRAASGDPRVITEVALEIYARAVHRLDRDRSSLYSAECSDVVRDQLPFAIGRSILAGDLDSYRQALLKLSESIECGSLARALDLEEVLALAYDETLAQFPSAQRDAAQRALLSTYLNTFILAHDETRIWRDTALGHLFARDRAAIAAALPSHGNILRASGLYLRTGNRLHRYLPCESFTAAACVSVGHLLDALGDGSRGECRAAEMLTSMLDVLGGYRCAGSGSSGGPSGVGSAPGGECMATLMPWSAGKSALECLQDLGGGASMNTSEIIFANSLCGSATARSRSDSPKYRQAVAEGKRLVGEALANSTVGARSRAQALAGRLRIAPPRAGGATQSAPVTVNGQRLEISSADFDALSADEIAAGIRDAVVGAAEEEDLLTQAVLVAARLIHAPPPPRHKAPSAGQAGSASGQGGARDCGLENPYCDDSCSPTGARLEASSQCLAPNEWTPPLSNVGDPIDPSPLADRAAPVSLCTMSGVSPFAGTGALTCAALDCGPDSTPTLSDGHCTCAADGGGSGLLGHSPCSLIQCAGGTPSVGPGASCVCGDLSNGGLIVRVLGTVYPVELSPAILLSVFR